MDADDLDSLDAMFPRAQATLILADSAQGGGGKVHMLGAGWSVTSSPTAPCAVVALVKLLAQDEARAVPFVLELVDEDGRGVDFGPGTNPLRFEGQLFAGQPAIDEPGVMVDTSCIVNLPMLPLKPARYTWKFEVDGCTATIAFQVVAAFSTDG